MNMQFTSGNFFLRAKESRKGKWHTKHGWSSAKASTGEENETMTEPKARPRCWKRATAGVAAGEP